MLSINFIVNQNFNYLHLKHQGSLFPKQQDLIKNDRHNYLKINPKNPSKFTKVILMKESWTTK